jgi:CHAT domain-containing protein
VAGLFQGQALLEAEAAREQIQDRAADARLLHFACHGEFRPDNPLFSGLALADGWLTTLDIFNLRLEASLVTLSACQTGRSVIGGGDELFGLRRAFLAAGAASLVMSHWLVEDRSTAALMEAFYRGLGLGETKAAALRAAQLGLLYGEDPAYAHPYFWAPFFLTGHTGPL